MRVIFLGSPDFAVPALSEIVAAGHEVVAVYSQPPRPSGRRGLELTPTAVHTFAEASGLPVFTPKSLRTAEVQEAFRAHDADVAVVVAYGLLLPKPILDAPKHGCLNIHPSLLPRWRGAAPIQRTLMAGDKETAVAIMQMDEGLDTGPVALSQHVAIGEDVTATELHDQLAKVGADLIVRALAALERDSLSFTPQSEDGVVYAEKISKDEARIDWNRTSRELHNHIRGLSAGPGAWCEVDIEGKPVRLKVLKSRVTANGSPVGPAGTLLNENFIVACRTGTLQLEQVQRAGRKVMSGREVLKGLPLKIGDRLSTRAESGNQPAELTSLAPENLPTRKPAATKGTDAADGGEV